MPTSHIRQELDRYCRAFQSPLTQNIFKAYREAACVQAGGDSLKADADVDFLLKTLRWLMKVVSPPYTPDPQALEKMKRFLREMGAMSDALERQDFDSTLKNKTQAYTDSVRGDLQAWLTIQRQRLDIVLTLEIGRLRHEISDALRSRRLKSKDRQYVDAVMRDSVKCLTPGREVAQMRGIIRKLKKVKRLLTLPPRRRGYTPESLAAAVVVAEFKKTFRRPRYREAAILLCAASPKLCKALTGKEKFQQALQVITDAYCRSEDVPKELERIVRRVPPSLVERTYNNLRIAPDPLSMVTEVRPHTPSPFDTTKSL